MHPLINTDGDPESVVTRVMHHASCIMLVLYHTGCYVLHSTEGLHYTLNSVLIKYSTILSSQHVTDLPSDSVFNGLKRIHQMEHGQIREKVSSVKYNLTYSKFIQFCLWSPLNIEHEHGEAFNFLAA